MLESLYFDVHKSDVLLKNQRKREAILNRRNRIPFLKIWRGAYKIYVGDVASIYFLKKFDIYQFEGLIISIKYGLKNINCTLCLRNVIMGVGIEYKVAYYANRLYYLSLYDYKRKKFIYRRANFFMFVKRKIEQVE